MKTIIYISGILGGLLLAIPLVGILAAFPQNDLFTGLELVMLGLVCLPLFAIIPYQHRKKIPRTIYHNRKPKDKTQCIFHSAPITEAKLNAKISV